jgi:hypothetical protein
LRAATKPPKIAPRAKSAGHSKETTMKKRTAAAIAAMTLAAALGGCAQMDSMIHGDAGWTTLIDGTHGLENFQANWTPMDGAIQATAGGKDPAYLVTHTSYRDFMVHAEFWASDDANSGVFLRCGSSTQIGDEICYEANIFDQRPDPTYGTGAIVKVAKAPTPMPKAGGKWNTYEITAQGTHLVLVLNGQTTVDVRDSKLAEGPFALQWGRGTIKFRKVEIRRL